MSVTGPTPRHCEILSGAHRGSLPAGESRAKLPTEPNPTRPRAPHTSDLAKGSWAMDLSRRLRLTLPVVLFALSLALPLQLSGQAQATTGVIRGTVTDSSGAPISGAIVTLRNRETNAVRNLNTNASGVYVATLLRVGLYDLGARALGFQEDRRDSVALRLGETLEESFA